MIINVITNHESHADKVTRSRLEWHAVVGRGCSIVGWQAGSVVSHSHSHSKPKLATCSLVAHLMDRDQWSSWTRAAPAPKQKARPKPRPAPQQAPTPPRVPSRPRLPTPPRCPRGRDPGPAIAISDCSSSGPASPTTPFDSAGPARARTNSSRSSPQPPSQPPPWWMFPTATPAHRMTPLGLPPPQLLPPPMWPWPHFAGGAPPPGPWDLYFQAALGLGFFGPPMAMGPPTPTSQQTMTTPRMQTQAPAHWEAPAMDGGRVRDHDDFEPFDSSHES